MIKVKVSMAIVSVVFASMALCLTSLAAIAQNTSDTLKDKTTFMRNPAYLFSLDKREQAAKFYPCHIADFCKPHAFSTSIPREYISRLGRAADEGNYQGNGIIDEQDQYWNEILDLEQVELLFYCDAKGCQSYNRYCAEKYNSLEECFFYDRSGVISGPLPPGLSVVTLERGLTDSEDFLPKKSELLEADAQYPRYADPTGMSVARRKLKGGTYYGRSSDEFYMVTCFDKIDTTCSYFLKLNLKNNLLEDLKNKKLGKLNPSGLFVLEVKNLRFSTARKDITSLNAQLKNLKSKFCQLTQLCQE